MTMQLRTPNAKPYALPVTRLKGAARSGLHVAADVSLSHPGFGEITVLAKAVQHVPDMVEELIFTLNGTAISLRCEQSLLTPLLQNAGLAAETSALEVDPQLAALVLEHLLTPALTEFEAAWSAELAVLSVGPLNADDGSSSGQVHLLRVSAPFWPAPVTISLSARQSSGDGVLHRLLEPLAGPPAAPPMHLAALVTLASPGFLVPFSDVAALHPGDALLLDSRWSPQTDARISIAGTYSASAVWRGNRFSLISAIQRPPVKDTPAMIPQADSEFTINDIPVTITLELDRIELPFSAIATLKPGSVLPFGTPMPETVRVMANGRHFATASLLQIDNQFGIRITALNGKPV